MAKRKAKLKVALLGIAEAALKKYGPAPVRTQKTPTRLTKLGLVKALKGPIKEMLGKGYSVAQIATILGNETGVAVSYTTVWRQTKQWSRQGPAAEPSAAETMGKAQPEPMRPAAAVPGIKPESVPETLTANDVVAAAKERIAAIERKATATPMPTKFRKRPATDAI